MNLKSATNLHGACSEQDELGRVLPGLHPPNPRERLPLARELLSDHLGDVHAARERNRAHRLARVAARGGVALDARLGGQGFEVDAHDAHDGVDGGDALAALAQGGAGRLHVAKSHSLLSLFVLKVKLG